jgi:hypothetical protein
MLMDRGAERLCQPNCVIGPFFFHTGTRPSNTREK